MAHNLLIRNGNVLVNDKLTFSDILIRDGKIAEIGKGITDATAYEVIDAESSLVLPGFIDIHTHGGAGVDINHAEVDDFKKLCEFFASQGTTSFLPTLLTDSKEKLSQCIEIIVQN